MSVALLSMLPSCPSLRWRIADRQHDVLAFEFPFDDRKQGADDVVRRKPFPFEFRGGQLVAVGCDAARLPVAVHPCRAECQYGVTGFLQGFPTLGDGPADRFERRVPVRRA